MIQIKVYLIIYPACTGIRSCHVIAQRRICTQPAAGSGVQVPRTLAKVGYRMLSILCLGVLLSQGIFYSLVTLDLTFHIS